MKTTIEVRAELDTQALLCPEEEGWRPIYDAVPWNIRPGDYVFVLEGDRYVDEFYVQDIFEDPEGLRINMIVDNKWSVLGLNTPITIYRRGTDINKEGTR